MANEKTLDRRTPVSGALDFARYLYDRGLIESETAEQVRRKAAEEHPQLGQIFVTRRMLTVRQVMDILDEQARTPGMRVGELAVRNNYITTTQLEEALRIQKTSRRHQLDVVRDLGVVAPGPLHEATVSYISLLEMTLST